MLRHTWNQGPNMFYVSCHWKLCFLVIDRIRLLSFNRLNIPVSSPFSTSSNVSSAAWHCQRNEVLRMPLTVVFVLKQHNVVLFNLHACCCSRFPGLSGAGAVKVNTLTQQGRNGDLVTLLFWAIIQPLSLVKGQSLLQPNSIRWKRQSIVYLMARSDSTFGFQEGCIDPQIRLVIEPFR